MKLKYQFLLVIGLLTALLATVVRPVWSPGIIENERTGTPEIGDDTRDWLRAEMRGRGIPGLSFALVVDGELAMVEAFGVSDYWTRTPLTTDTLVEVASHSKVITALAAIRAVEEGRLSLDQPLTDYRADFDMAGEFADRITLGMLLTHSAGLGNALETVPVADQPPGDHFRYSGVGFEQVGELIAHDAGTDLPQALRTSVLTPLGFSDQATYSQVNDDKRLASPHVIVTQPLLLFVLPGAVIWMGLVLLLALVVRLGLLKQPLSWLSLRALAGITAISLLVPFLLLSNGNAIRYAFVDGVFLILVIVLVGGIRNWLRSNSMLTAMVTLVVGLALVMGLSWRIPIPLEERASGFPAAAGLRASATDMGRLLTALVNPPAGWERSIAELTTPRIQVNDENSWGLGIGIQQIAGTKVIWHWGVNYPGYQSLMLGLPESGDGLVVLMNGGPIITTPGGPRYPGLELARELAARVLPGPHGSYWYGVQ